jgi:copper chaperone NosL
MVTRRGFLALMGAAGAAGVAAIAGITLLPGESKPTGDPVIHLGRENCARCSMLISDVRFAAAWRDPAGQEKHFDDIGCMVFLEGERHPAAGTRFWVHDYQTESWLDAATAAYVLAEGIKTPMSYGVAAAATIEGAQRIAANLTSARTAEWAALPGSLSKRG